MQPFRLQTLANQGNKCALCGQPLKLADAVLDHDHVTGECRGVLHRGCNSMLGKIENHRKLAKMTSAESLSNFLAGVLIYIHNARLGVAYPTHRTADEKRIRRNTKARQARAKAKEQA